MWQNVYRFLRTRFSLHKDKEDETAIVESIRRGIEFRGINVWVLIFAVLLASLGLNVNSTAVIIGAMLISPLMGPIMGIGLGLGISDFELLKAAGKNLAIMVGVSLIASSLYFLLSPLHQAQSELLARTSPTIWDVLIALFGGLAGIVAGASREKGTVIPGVAIATALMPPLCTAGFGIARGDFYFFIGAFYLFCINAVFISLSTLIVVRLLKFKLVSIPDKQREKRIRNVLSIVVVITVIPSLLIAYFTVKQEIAEQRVQEYIRKEFQFPETFVLTQRIDFKSSSVDVVLAGSSISDDTIRSIREARKYYGLENFNVDITQGSPIGQEIDLNELRTDIITELYTSNKRTAEENESTINSLKQEIAVLKNPYPVPEIAQELKALNANAKSISIQNAAFYNIATQKTDSVTCAYIQFSKVISRSEEKKIHDWLKIRTKADSLRIFSSVK